MGKGDKWREDHSPNKISENMEKVKQNEKKNPTVKFKPKKKRVNKDGSVTYVY